MPWNDPMGDSSDPGSSNYGGDNNSRDRDWDTPSILRGPGTYANPNYKGATTKGYGMKNLLAGAAGALTMNGKLLGYAASPHNKTANLNANGFGYGPRGSVERDRGGDGGGWNTGANPAGGGAGNIPTENPISAPGSTSSSLFPSVYSDPVTGRLLTRSQDSSEQYQQLLDQILGTHVAQTPGDPDNPLLAYMNSGLSERVANENLDNTVSNTMKAGDDLNARRGLGNSTMQDATRASLGLSTAQARNQNKLTAQDEANKKRMNLAAFLQGGQTTNNAMTMGLADMENQRKIAEITGNRQDSLAAQNLDYLRGIQSDNNRNAWINAAGNAAGSIDWESLFS